MSVVVTPVDEQFMAQRFVGSGDVQWHTPIQHYIEETDEYIDCRLTTWGVAPVDVVAQYDSPTHATWSGTADVSGQYQCDCGRESGPFAVTGVGIAGSDDDGKIDGAYAGATGDFDVSDFSASVSWGSAADKTDGWWQGTVPPRSDESYDVVVTDLQWDGGGIRLEFQVAGPVHETYNRERPLTSVKLFWARGLTTDSILPGPLAEMPVYWNSASGVYSISGLPLPPRGVGHLLAVADCEGAVKEASEQNNVRAVPVAQDDEYAMRLDEPVIADAVCGVLANERDASGAARTAVLVTNPDHGHLVYFKPDGSFRYEPEPGYYEPAKFTYRDSEGGISSNVAVVTIYPYLESGEGPEHEMHDDHPEKMIIPLLDERGLKMPIRPMPLPIPVGQHYTMTFLAGRGLLGGLPSPSPPFSGESAQSVVLALLDKDSHVLALSTGTPEGGTRIDWPSDPAMTYFLVVSGNAGSLGLCMGSPVRWNSGETSALVSGTDSYDTFSVALGSSSTFSVNELEYTSTRIKSIEFVGRDGWDTAVLTASPGRDDLAVLQPAAGSLTEGDMTVKWGGTEIVTVSGAGGNDVARLYDSPGDDRFESNPTQSTLEGSTYSLRAVGFRYVYAYASTGSDQAVLHDSTGNDTFVYDLAKRYGALYGTGFYNRANAFKSVVADSAAGVDIAQMVDSSGDDLLDASPTAATLSGGDLSGRAEKFRYLSATANAGGNDKARLHDSAGVDVFAGTPTYSTLSGTAYSQRVGNFDAVEAYATPGANDVARFYDSSGDETFAAHPAYGNLSGKSFSYRAEGFRFLYAYATAGGNDKADLYDSSGADTFTAHPTYAAMSGNGYYNRANYFDSVVAHASAGADLANLYDSAAEDLFEAYLTDAVLSGAGFSNRAGGFPHVTAYSDAGGKDTARLYGTPGDETITGVYEYTRIQGGTSDIAARAFEKTYLLTRGGSDKATLYDSSGSDRLDAAGKWAKLAYVDRFLELSELTSLGRVKAVSSKGGNDTKHAEATDFVLETQGPWKAV